MKWCCWRGLNSRPPPYQNTALVLRLLKSLAFPLLVSRRVTICSRVFGASGTGNSTGYLSRDNAPSAAPGLLSPVRHRSAFWPASPNEWRTVSWRRFITEYAPAAILVRVRTFVGEQRLNGSSACMPLQPTRLVVQPPDRRQLLEVTELCLPHRSLQHVDGAIVDLERHGKGMPVLPPWATENRAGSLKQ